MEFPIFHENTIFRLNSFMHIYVHTTTYISQLIFSFVRVIPTEHADCTHGARIKITFIRDITFSDVSLLNRGGARARANSEQSLTKYSEHQCEKSNRAREKARFDECIRSVPASTRLFVPIENSQEWLLRVFYGREIRGDFHPRQFRTPPVSRP